MDMLASTQSCGVFCKGMFKRNDILNVCRREDMRWRYLKRRILLGTICVVGYLYFSGRLPEVPPNSYTDFKQTHVLSKTLLQAKRAWFSMEHEVQGTGRHRLVDRVDCKAIVDGNSDEITKAKQLMSQVSPSIIPDSSYSNMTADCAAYVAKRGFKNHSIILEELSFPIAFSVLMYKDVYQFEKLLRAIYRPHNAYCIHVDADAHSDVHAAIDGIAGCLGNVYVASRKEYIVYAGFTRLQADLNCMSDLLNIDRPWRYFINLPSQQFPLKTNLEIVKILKTYNGANDIEGLTGGRLISDRFKHRHIYKHVDGQLKPKIVRTSNRKDNPPRNISIVKGSAYGVFSREFVEFVINSKVARELLDWFRDVLSPDEYYWATLNFNPHLRAPGSFTGKPDSKPWLAVFAAWGGRDKCAGKFVRGVCVFGVGDLQGLVKRRELFVNKFYHDYQPLALDCLEEWYHNRTFNRETVNMTFYQSLPFVRKP